MNINQQNAHARDALIHFEPGPHKYTCNGEGGYSSVTKWLHSHFKPFDADGIIKKMMCYPAKWAKSPYFGKTPDEIKAGWDKNRDEAAAAGTEMHQHIEQWATPTHPPVWVKTNKDLLEYNNSIGSEVPQHYLDFVKDHPDLIPYRTEWMIFDEDVRIAGSIDMVGVSPPDPLLGTVATPIDENSSPDHLVIYDWKRCKEIKQTTDFKEFALTDGIKHLPDTNFWHYSLQLNIYKAILEAKYDKKVDAMYLVCLHPNLPSYQLFPVPDLSKEVAGLFASRKAQINMSALQESESSVKK